MADKRENFATLEDATGEGSALAQMLQGDNPSAKNGAIGFAFKDSSGNVVLPTLNSDGSFAVTVGGSGVCKQATGKVTATGGDDDVAALVLALNKTYRDIELSASNLHSTAWSLVYIDDVGGTPTETILWQGVTGPGQFGVHINFDCVEFDTNSGTGTQNLVLRGNQLSGANSDLRAYFGVKES